MAHHPQGFGSTQQMVTEAVATNGVNDNNKNVGKMDDPHDFNIHQQTRHINQHAFNLRQASSLQNSYNQHNSLHSSRTTLTTMKPVDVRMKRHPELQPFVPSDRVVKSSMFGGSSLGLKSTAPITTTTTTTAKKAASRAKGLHDNQSTNFRSNVTVNNGNSNGTGSGNRYHISSRLDQLARPKRVFSRVAPSSTSNSTATNSLASNSIASNPTPIASNPISLVSNPISLASAGSSAPLVTSSASTYSEESVDTSTTPSQNLRDEEAVEPVESSTTTSQTHRDIKEEEPSDAYATPSRTYRDQEAEETSEISATFSQALRDEEELRLKTEAELKESAKRDEQERQSRQLYLDSILSKFNISQ